MPFLAVCLAVTSCATPVAEAVGEQRTLTYSTYLSRDHPFSRTFEDWMATVSARTGGAVRFQSFYDGSLCPSDEALSCVEDGRVDIAFDAPPFNPVLSVANIGSIGFQTPDFDTVTRALNELHSESDELAEEYRDRNQRLLFLGSGTPPVLALSRAASVTSLGDLDGLSVRATGGMATGLQLLGMSTAAIEATQIYESIERGVVSGTGYGFDTFTDTGLHEVAPQLFDISDMGIYNSVNFSVNLDVWESLTPEVRAAMDVASAEAVGGGMTGHQVDAIMENCGVLRDAGIGIVPLGRDEAGTRWASEGSANQSAAWVRANSGSVADPQGLLDRYLELIAELRPDDERTLADYCASV
ncbi:hypothetical protein AD006_28525 (plasmid) [Pseudonocardia sp. EC080610-09]|nr:hypothetical protein AD006_28525 [Pseudonocardia sp. EC080610-09]ALL85244.1 hypothetical protein AD017_28915 [Pseudonocardia sp. EC080619-01]